MSWVINFTAALVGMFAFLIAMSIAEGVVEGLRAFDRTQAAFLVRDVRWPVSLVVGARVYLFVRRVLNSLR